MGSETHTPSRQFFLHLSVVSVKRFAVCAILLGMPIRSSVVAQSPRPLRSNSLAELPQVRLALDWLQKNVNWVTEQQIHLTEIPAPSFHEARRAEAVKKLFSAGGLVVHLDKLGNVIGELPGAQEKDVVLLSAHLDTVFPAGTEVTVKRRRSPDRPGNLRQRDRPGRNAGSGPRDPSGKN
jgi:hypothetical protein